MTLEEYRTKYLLTYEKLADKLGFSVNKTFRICKDQECIKLMDAHRVEKRTRGEVTIYDLAPEDCT